MEITVKGKIAMVTGAASGIGQKCAEMLAESGAKVAMADIQPDNLAKALKAVQSKGTAKSFQLDVSDVKAVTAMIEKVRKEMGEIDVLVCAAGLGPPPGEVVTESDWDRMLDVNTKGLFFCNQEVAMKCMIPRKTGSIVNIASITGMVGFPAPFIGASHYHASKGGVMAVTQQTAMEWAPYNVRVNAVCPGFVKTPMTAPLWEDKAASDKALEWTPLGQFCETADIASAVCFLASDVAKMITGVCLPVDGGWTAR